MSKGVVKLGCFQNQTINKQLLKKSKVDSLAHKFYLSPELDSGAKYSFPAEVWSMGMLFLEMAMLERPEKFLQVIDKKRIVDEKVVEALTERYSPDVINLLRAILKIEPQERPRMINIL